MSAGSTVLLALGLLAIVAAVALIALDYLGRGDTSGLDPKDLGILGAGVVLVGVGAALGRARTPPSPTPA